LGVIDAILNDDRQRPVKQRHTSKRIFERLKEEHGFTGGYTIVKDYVRTATLRGQEVFVPLMHPAGEAQVDFGEALVVIAGVEHKAHYLVMDLPHSDDCFVARSHTDPLRQHEDCCGEDPGRRGTATDAGLLRVAELLSVCR
jgi:transposase